MKHVWLFGPKLDLVFFFFPVVMMFGIQWSGEASALSARSLLFNQTAVHVFVSLIPLFYDQSLRSALGWKIGLGSILVILGSIFLASFNFNLFKFSIYVLTFHHVLMQFYGFIRRTHRSSCDSPSLKKLELHALFLVAFVGFAFRIGTDKLANQFPVSNYNIFVPMSPPSLLAKILLLVFGVGLLTVLFYKYKQRSDNPGSAMLLVGAFGFLFVGPIVFLGSIVTMLCGKICHDLAYLYFVHSRIKTLSHPRVASGYRQTVYYLLFCLVGYLWITRYSPVVWANMSATNKTLIEWVPALIHYYFDSVAWKPGQQAIQV